MVTREHTRTGRPQPVVSMTKSALDLIVDRLRERVASTDVLVQAFAEWLGVYDLGLEPLGQATGLWTPREFAVAGLRHASGKATTRVFAEGLRTFQNREFFRPYMPQVFEADPLAILSVAIGIRHSGDVAAGQWIADIATRAAVGETDSWRKGLLAAAVAAVRADPFRAPAELLVALATHGIGTTNSAIKQAAYDVALSLDDSPGERSAARLAVLLHPAISTKPERLFATELGESKLPGYVSSEGAMKILLFASNPTTTDPILLDEEIRAIEEQIARSAGRDAVQVVLKLAVRPGDLHQALLNHEPTIVHVSGHGAGRSGIVLHGDVPDTESRVTGDALKHLFATLRGNIRVVVLNVCNSAEQAKKVAEVIDFVVGMDDSVDDETARKFAAAFYLGIASSQAISTAFQMGISSVKLHGLPDDHVPRLYVRPNASENEVLVKKVLLRRK